MKRSTFISAVAGALAVGAIVYAQPIDLTNFKVRNLTISNSASVGNDLTVGDDLTVTDLASIGTLDAGTVNVANQLGAGNLVLTTTSPGGINFTDPNSIQRITWGNTVYIGQHVATNRIFSTGGFSTPSLAIGAVGGGGVLADSATAPTVTACSGGTAASMTWNNGSANFRFDVATSCTGESTAVITLPATTTCWTCYCFNTGAATHIEQTTCGTTSATITHYGTSVATPADWTDGADIQCMCRGG